MGRDTCLYKLILAILGMISIGSLTVSNENKILQNAELEWEWVVRPEEYSECFLIGEELIAVKDENSKYRIIDKNGEYAFSDEYDEISKYSERVAAVQRNGKCFYIDTQERTLIEETYEDVKSFHESKAAIKKDGLWGFINLKEDIIVSPLYEQVHDFNENYAAVRRNGQWGFVDTNGTITVSCQYDEVRNFHEGLAIVREGEKWGVINQNGEQIVPCQYDFINDFSGGFAAIEKDDKWGYINNKGQISIGLKYDSAGDFHESKAAVGINGYFDGYMDAWAYIDEKDNIQIDFYPYSASEGRMLYVGEFKNEMAFVSDDFYCIMDCDGNYIFDGHASEFIISSLTYNEKYDAIPAYIYTDESMTVKKYGLVGLDGKMRLEPIFDYVHEIEGDYVLVSNIVDGEWKYGVIKIVEK